VEMASTPTNAPGGESRADIGSLLNCCSAFGTSRLFGDGSSRFWSSTPVYSSRLFEC